MNQGAGGEEDEERIAGGCGRVVRVKVEVDVVVRGGHVGDLDFFKTQGVVFP